MALNYNDLLALMKQVAKANPSAATAYSYDGKNFTYEQMNETLRRECQELAGDWQSFRENKNTIYRLIEDTISEVLPKKVEERYGDFAEVRTLAQGDKYIFRRKLTSNNRAKQFITRVGLAGKYEVFKLGKKEESFEIRTSAIGGAAQIGFEEFLDGRVDFAEVTQIIMEGMDELIYKEAAHALKASINQLPPANRIAVNGFNEEAMDELINIASAYGTPTIYCTYEFAVKLVPTEAWRYTEAMKDELWKTGRLATYKNTRVVILEQGFEDATNSKKVIDPGYVWILPSGADAKPIKIVMEGATIVNEYQNHDLSRELQVYKKVGVGALLANNICAYVDTSLLGKMDTWTLSNPHIKDYTGT